MIKNRFEFKEADPLKVPAVICCFCNTKMTVNEVKANELMEAKPEDYICEICYMKSHQEEYE